ncbi:MAG: cobyrinate a,c-diamide synthase [Aquimonas sp.]|nr:cobyrinate a,c-diamide synthase [Aquimonas sp.]
MSHRCRALLIAAPASGQGKTSFTAALTRRLRAQGRRVSLFKVGPDFLDPLLLSAASGTPVHSLDLWMGSEAEVRARLYAAAGASDLLLVEGMMGLFDGQPSAADLAERFGLQVLGLIDANALAQSFGAIALGLASYRPGLQFAGVAANRIASGWHAHLLRDSLPPAIRWLGGLSECVEGRLPERHLGLHPAAEVDAIESRLQALAAALTLDEGLFEALPEREFVAATLPPAPRSSQLRIAVARDAAFCFLYPANLELLQAAGAELRYFSPLAGDALPSCDAVWLPAGYPELHLSRLSARTDLWAALHAHVVAGRPLLAECGGFLCLLNRLQGAAMAGLLPGRAHISERLAGLGPLQVQLPEGRLRGHSFHHARAELGRAPIAWACDPAGAPTREPVYRLQRLTAGFMHFYFPSNPEAALALFQP